MARAVKRKMTKQTGDIGGVTSYGEEKENNQKIGL
jgi:hypothetical protein